MVLWDEMDGVPADNLVRFLRERVRMSTRDEHCPNGVGDCEFEQVPFVDIPDVLNANKDRLKIMGAKRGPSGGHSLMAQRKPT